MSYYRQDRVWARNLALFLWFMVAVIGVTLTYGQIMAKYNYQKRYSYHWNLADKSSTIPAKEQHINAFVKALKEGKARGDFSDNNAIFLKTPDNSFDANFAAIETLAQRLGEIQQMDPKSFEYNTAIQQITEQEQGESYKMMSVFYGCYELANYFYVWGWIDTILVLTFIISAVVGAFLIGYYLDGH